MVCRLFDFINFPNIFETQKIHSYMECIKRLYLNSLTFDDIIRARQGIVREKLRENNEKFRI